MPRLGVLAVLLWLSTQAVAFDPQPFELELEGFFYRGLPIKVVGTQTLAHRGNGVWRAEIRARGPFIRMEERADFRWKDNTVVPIAYHYSLRAPFEREEKRILFQPEQNRIQVDIDGHQTNHEYTADWYDPLSYTVLLLRDLEQGLNSSKFTILSHANERAHVFTRTENHDLPERAVVLSQEQPRRGITYIILDKNNHAPAHLLRWRNGSIDYHIRTLSGQMNGQRLNGFPHWPNPRRNVPRE
ncbi:MAG: hypothetical protein WED11_09015 [Natronospirillum sp.]